MPDRPDPLTDPVARTLARFTPAAPGLDRDELLFRAGRASARPARLWKGAAALLLVTNAATLAVWLSTPPRTEVVVESRIIPAPGPSDESPPTEPESPVPSWVVQARRTGELPPPTPGTDARMVESRPLSVRSDPSDI